MTALAIRSTQHTQHDAVFHEECLLQGPINADPNDVSSGELRAVAPPGACGTEGMAIVAMIPPTVFLPAWQTRELDLESAESDADETEVARVVSPSMVSGNNIGRTRSGPWRQFRPGIAG